MSMSSQPPTRSLPPDGMAALRSAADLMQALCHAALETWRLTRLVSRLCATDAERVQAIADRLSARLAQSGVEIQDHTNQTYVDGLAVEILSTEDRPDLPLAGLYIVETVKPSVYIAGQLATQGQVILGRGVAAEGRTPDGSRDD